MSPWNSQDPVREELFSAERLEEHARSLAVAQAVVPKSAKGHPLAGRLADNGTVVLDAYRSMVQAIDEGRSITPAAEWLIDNYHLIEKQIRELRSDLPPEYYRQLPKLATGPFAGYPRVFGLAWAFVAHTDSRFDVELMFRYVRAYQEVQFLTIGELWAVPLTLRIVLIENLRRIAQQIVDSRTARQQADGLANRLLGVDGRIVDPVLAIRADLEGARLSDAFAVQLVHRLRDQDPKFTPALTWLDQRLAAQGMTADTVVRDEHRKQGAANVTMRNIITSLRLISDVDWKDLFERASLVDAALAAHGEFQDMDFSTRNLYRSAIEELARGAERSELDVANGAIDAARRARELGAAESESRRGDPGYHLIGGGRLDFEATIGYRLPLRKWPERLGRTLGIGGYAISIAVVTSIIIAVPLFALAGPGLGGIYLILLGALGALPAIDAAIAVVNRAVTMGFGATALPALELLDGVPSHLRTLVAVPTMLTTPQAIEEQIERLEIHYLASPEGNLHFALLSDWIDAATERAAGDDALLAAAAEGVARLNRRHGLAPGGARFLLLHRRRVWNDSEGRWIGWERKRGKLHELNRLLRGATDTTFLPIMGSPPLPPDDIRYVVTLDADTRLPRDTVRRLIGKMAHPLNRPRFDAAAGRVVEGYAVLQPRVTPSLPVGQEGSLFQRIFSSSERHRSLRRGGLRRLPGPVRRRFLCRQGNLRRRRIRIRAGRQGAGLDLAQSRSVRGHIRPRRARFGCRGRRGIPVALRCRRRAAPSMGARRLAIAAVDSGSRAEGARRRPSVPRHTGDRPMEDARQSAPHADRARGDPDPVRRVDDADPGGPRLDRLRPCDHCSSDADPGRHRHSAAAPGNYLHQPCSRARRRRSPFPDPFGAYRHLPGPSGLADGRCHRADVVALAGEPQESAGVGDRRPVQDRSRKPIW